MLLTRDIYNSYLKEKKIISLSEAKIIFDKLHSYLVSKNYKILTKYMHEVQVEHKYKIFVFNYRLTKNKKRCT